MRRAWLNLRYTLPERIRFFKTGLERHGYRIEMGLPVNAGNRDIFVTWNRIGRADAAAQAFQNSGRTVLVAENAAWGNEFCGRQWYSLARNYHNTAGCFPVGDSTRWDSLGVELPAFRTTGETVILPQRGIGSPPVAMPLRWPDQALAKHGGRIRRHPGRRPGISLEEDLQRAGRVITWGSGAAIKALLMGIPVTSEMPHWIGERDNTESCRLEMFRHLAWAQWRWREIESGEAFSCFI